MGVGYLADDTPGACLGGGEGKNPGFSGCVIKHLSLPWNIELSRRTRTKDIVVRKALKRRLPLDLFVTLLMDSAAYSAVKKRKEKEKKKRANDAQVCLRITT